MRDDIIVKIDNLLQKRHRISEDETLSLMVRIRIVLESMAEADMGNFPYLNLFCNWSVHAQISASNTSFRLLEKLNRTLVSLRHSGDYIEIGAKFSEVIFLDLRREMKLFFSKIKVDDTLIEDNRLWGTVFLKNLIELIQNTRIFFPETARQRPTLFRRFLISVYSIIFKDSQKKRNSTASKIYDAIVQNPIKQGAGIIAIWISKVTEADCGIKNYGERMCFHLKAEDTSTIASPIVIDVRLK